MRTWKTEPVRVLIADDSAAVCSALELALSGQEGIELVGVAADWTELGDLVGVSQPDVVLLDWGLPGNDGAARLRALRLACPVVRVVALSACPGDRQAALLAGADAFVSKADHPDRLHAVLRTLAERRATLES